MSAKKLLLATIGAVCLQTSVQGEQWSGIKCRTQCTQVSCADAKQWETCEANCAHLDDSILEACRTAKPQGSAQTTKPTPPPRRGLPQQSQPQPQPLPVEPEIKGNEEQTQPEKQDSTSFELKKQASNKAPQRPTQPLPTTPHLKKQPSGHNAGEKTLTAEEKLAAQITALNEGKGVKVKHMKEKLEGLEKLISVLEKRVGLLEPLAEQFFGVHEVLVKLQKNTGFDKPEIRNNPEHDIEYKPEQFSATSSAAGTLDGTSCQAALRKIQQKIKETKDKNKSGKLSAYGRLLTEMCARTKDLNRDPATKVADAEAVNKAFSEAEKIK